MSGNNNIFLGVCKFGIIGKRRMRCVWGNGQDLATLKGLLCQGMLFDTMKALKTKFSVHNTFFSV